MLLKKLKKKSSRFFLLGAIGISLTSATFAVASCSLTVNYSPSFFNYEEYMSEEIINLIENDFRYKQFGDLDEFEQQVKSNRTIGGVGSDYSNAKLVKQGFLRKIDFNNLLGLTYANSEELGIQLKNIYTDFSFGIMEAFNEYLGDVDEDGIDDYLWEYMIPYFGQQKVIAFNIERDDLLWTEEELEILNYPSQYGQIFNDLSYQGILNTLKSKGYDNLVVNDYIRDNLMIGSEKTNQFTGVVTNDNYQSFIDNFISTIEDGFGFSFQSTNNILLSTSGTEALQAIIDPSLLWDSAIIYNGDALDAYWGSDNFNNPALDGIIRIISPENPTYLLDGIVITQDTTGPILDQLYETLKDSLFSDYSEEPTIDEDGNILSPQLLINFDFVNYTPVFQNIYDFVLDNYFSENPIENQLEKYIFEVDSSKLSNNNITWPISDELQSYLVTYYSENVYN